MMTQRTHQIIQEYEAVLQTSFSEQREHLWENHGRSPILAAARLVLRLCGTGSAIKVVDCGCGTGADLVVFPTIFKQLGHTGSLTLAGCDITPGMVAYCQQRDLQVVEADFLAPPPDLAAAQLVWAHFSILHLEMKELSRAAKVIARLAASPGVVCVGFKTGEDITRIDPADDRLPVDRLQTFYRPETVAEALSEAGMHVAYRIITPSNDPAYDYCWLIAHNALPLQ
jgi:SAM-dependent methyltransferase